MDTDPGTLRTVALKAHSIERRNMTKRCPKCQATLPAPREISEGLPGIKYEVCDGCGWTRAITRKSPKEKIQ